MNQTRFTFGNKAFAAVLVGMGLMLSSCESIETPTGEMPAQYLEVARSYEGSFKGTVLLDLEGRHNRRHYSKEADATLTIQFDGAKPVVSGEVFLKGGEICKFEFGQMSVVGHNELGVYSARFPLKDKYCLQKTVNEWIKGNYATFHFYEKTKEIRMRVHVENNRLYPTRDVRVLGKFKR